MVLYKFGKVRAEATLAANEPSYPQSDQEPANPDHSGANKSANSEHFLLFLLILSKRYFWHAIALITALALGFVASWLLFLPVTKQAPPHRRSKVPSATLNF